MAVDTRDKRFSLLGLGTPLPRVFPDPDGGNFATNNERAMLLYLYHGLELDVAGEAIGLGSKNTFFRRRRID